MKLDKYHLSLAGEDRVCAELLKRGVFATITFGSMKSADVYAVGSNRRAAAIEVKASQTGRFVTGFYQKDWTEQNAPDFWVLYSLRSSTAGDEERLFVLTHEEVGAAQAEVNWPGKSLTPAEQRIAAKKGVDNISPRIVEDYENAWDKITDFCNEDFAD